MKLVFSVICGLAIPLVSVICTSQLEVVQPDWKPSHAKSKNDPPQFQEQLVTLHHAAKHKQHDIVEQLLDGGTNADEIDSDGRTPLYFAALNGHYDVLILLLCANADVHVRDRHELTALHAAASNGHVNCLYALSKMGAIVDAEDTNRMTPLHCAALNGHHKAVAALLALGADVSPRDSLLQTPLHVASERGHAKTVAVLLERGADVKAVDSCQRTPLLQASRNGHARVAQLLVGRGADIRALDQCEKTALHLAAEEKHYHVILVLLDCIHIASSANSILGWSSLHLAAYTNRLDVARGLLDAGVDIDATDALGSTALHNAAHNNHCNMIQLLIDRGANVNAFNSHGQTPLHLAARKNHATAVLLLLRHGACAAVMDRSQSTPFHIAVRKRNASVIRVFLSVPQTTAIFTRDILNWSPVHYAAYMGDLDALVNLSSSIVNARDAHGLTPLHCAALGGRAETVRFLLENHASITVCDKDKWTSLHCAVLRGCVEAIFPLLVSLDARASDGATPLHVAAMCGNVSAMSVLLQHRADIGALDQHKHTPLHTAALYGHLEMLNVFLPQYASATVIHAAAVNGSTEIMLLLLKAGQDLHARDHNQMTPLHHAVAHGHHVAAKLLLSQDPSLVHEKDVFGMTPLHYAAQKGHPVCAQLLLALDADCSATDKRERTPLFLAALHGHSDLIDALLTHGASIEVDSVHLKQDRGGEWDHLAAAIALLEERDTEATVSSIGLAPLHAAAWNGHCGAASILLGRGVNVNISDTYGLTPLCFASYNGHYAMIALLLSNEVNMNSINIDGEIPLLFAAKEGHYEAVALLLKYTCRMDKSVLVGALCLAAKEGHTSVTHIILHHGVPNNMWPYLYLSWTFISAMISHISAVHLLLHHAALTDMWFYSFPLSIAAMTGHMEVTKLLLDAGANTRMNWLIPHNPFSSALIRDMHAATDLLLEYENSTIPNERTLRCLFDVVHKPDNWKVIAMLLNKGLDPDKKITVAFQNGEHLHLPLLHYAAYCGQHHGIKTLLDHGANIHATDDHNQTPFFLAVKHVNVRTAKLLREHGADEFAKDKNGETPLSMTINCIRELRRNNECNYRRFEMLLILLENATAINFYAASLSWNLLHRIAYIGRVEALESWMEDNPAAQGRSVDPRDEFSSTPLHYAALFNHLDIAWLLIINRAAVNAKNYIGQTPLYYAAMNGHHEMVDLLLKNGANGAIAYDEANETPLHVAAQKRHYKTVCVLLRDKSLIPHAKSALNWTPLHVIAYIGDLFALNELLLRHDTLEINARDIFGATALHYAVMTCNNGAAKTLLKEGADLFLKNHDGDTPLHIAAVYECLDMISLLFSFGASGFYSVNADGNTPFMCAIKGGCLDVLALFIREDALARRKLG